MKESLRFGMLFLGEVLIAAIAICFVIVGGSISLFDYFMDLLPLVATVAGALATLIVSGLLKDFGKAFNLALKTDIDIVEGKKACLALQCTMISVFVWTIITTIVSVVAAQYGLCMNPMEPFAVAHINALCAASPGCGIMIILLLCPIYYRLKRLTILKE